MGDVPPTALLYFDDTFKFECSAVVCAVEEITPDATATDATVPQKYAIVLDKTVAYPAGGGQPSDTGRLVFRTAGGDVCFTLTDAIAGKDGVVRHVGTFDEEGYSGDRLEVGTVALVKIDGDARLLHARIHSAGHLLDVAVANLGYDSNALKPSKGCHRPDAAYVEYEGKVEGLDKDAFTDALNEAIDALIGTGGKTSTRVMDYASAKKACGGSLPAFVKEGSRPRVVVILENTEGCPCGGTHVGDVRDIGAFRVTGVRVKKGLTRISYTIEGMHGHVY
jgi:Ser-tRNA(Ala) deacylase AlaX